MLWPNHPAAVMCYLLLPGGITSLSATRRGAGPHKPPIWLRTPQVREQTDGIRCFSAKDSFKRFSDATFGSADHLSGSVMQPWNLRASMQNYIESSAYRRIQTADLKAAWAAAQEFLPHVSHLRQPR